MPKVITEIDNHILTIIINRPDVRNCIDGETADLLSKAWKAFRDDDSLFVAILTGSGSQSFCAGADLKNLRTLGPASNASKHARRTFITHGEGYLGYTRQIDIFKPIFAAINGYAVAGGLELACLADIRIVEEHAEFGVACRRWDIPLLDGGTQRLTRIIGMGWAMELILTGKFIDAKEAYRIGLVNEVVPRGESLLRAKEIARKLVELPQTAMRTDKQAAVMGYNLTLEEGLRLEAEVGQDALYEKDFLEGVRAFSEKRKGKYNI